MSASVSAKHHATMLAPWLAMLAMSSSLIGQFIVFGVPLFMREAGASSKDIGLVFLAAIPFVARFLWAPLLDRRGLARQGHYRSWVLGTQCLIVPVLIGLALLSPATDTVQIVGCLMALAVLVGTQVMAVDAITVQHVSTSDTPRVLAWQKAGSALAGFTLGGVLIYALGHLGWFAVVLSLAAVHSAVLLVLLAKASLDRGLHASPTPSSWSLQRYVSVFRRPGVVLVFAVTLLVTMGADIPYAMKSILLKDAGFTVSQSGLVGICLGNLSGLLAVLCIRPLIEKQGGLTMLVWIGLVSVGLAVAYLLLAPVWPVQWLTAVFVVSAGALVYGASVCESALLYPRVDKANPASEVSAFNAGQGVLLLTINSLATQQLDTLGLSGILVLACGVSVAGVVLGAARRQQVAV